jgi:hypothetical protein
MESHRVASVNLFQPLSLEDFPRFDVFTTFSAPLGQHPPGLIFGELYSLAPSRNSYAGGRYQRGQHAARELFSGSVIKFSFRRASLNRD